MNGALVKIICASALGITTPGANSFFDTVCSYLFLKRANSIVYFCWEVYLSIVRKIY